LALPSLHSLNSNHRALVLIGHLDGGSLSIVYARRATHGPYLSLGLVPSTPVRFAFGTALVYQVLNHAEERSFRRPLTARTIAPVHEVLTRRIIGSTSVCPST